MAKTAIEKERDLFLKPCKTRQEVAAFIKYFFGLHLPDVTVSRFADTNPLDVIWEVYRICVLKINPNNIQELLFVAGRGSGKTLGMAIAELMVLIHDKREVVHVGAIQNQAERCYNYQKTFLYNRKIKPLVMPHDIPDDERILEKANMSKSIFNIDGHKLALEVIPCTLKAVNGPHVPLVVVDEIDTVSGEGLRAFKDITGMIDTKSGKKALRVGISTRKSRYGLMNRQMENADAENRAVRAWTAFEFTERCPDSRSGTKPIKLFVNQDEMDVLTPEQFEKKDITKKKDFVEHDALEGCAKCPLFSICLTDAKKQTSQSPMLKTIDELIQKVRAEGADWALAQLMNLKPSVEGVVFKEFSEKTHMKSWNEMWFTLTGTEFPVECTHDIFVKKCHEMGLPCYGGIDWGFTHPNTVVYFFIDKRENIYVVRCDGITQWSQPAWIHYLKMKYHNMYRCQLYAPDQADQGSIQEMKKAGLPVVNEKAKSDVNVGVQLIKKFLKVPGSGEPKLFLAKETCQHLAREFSLYHYKTDAAGIVTDEFDTEDDHWIDALRYPLVVLLGKSNIILSGSGLDLDQNSVVDKNGSYTRTPTAEEFAMANNIKVNSNEPDQSKLGKIGKKSELDDDDGGGESGSSGGFLWSL